MNHFRYDAFPFSLTFSPEGRGNSSNVKLYHMSILEDEVFLHHLAIVDPIPPDAGIFQFVGEVLMNGLGGIQEGASDF